MAMMIAKTATYSAVVVDLVKGVFLAIACDPVNSCIVLALFTPLHVGDGCFISASRPTDGPLRD